MAQGINGPFTAWFEQARETIKLERQIEELQIKTRKEREIEFQLRHALLAKEGYGCMEEGPCYIGLACRCASCQAKARAAAPQ